MAVAAPAARAKETVRQKRERDAELLVWPDLVFVEFICAILFTVSFVILSVYIDAPLLPKANAGITPDPSKAPWYFMNLQELLLHMDKGLAGVIVPTILLIGLMAIPYVDRNHDGQGGWFATANSVRITMFSFVYTGLLLTWLILWDNSSHVKVYERLPVLWGSDNRLEWPGHKGEMFFESWPGGDFLRVIWDFLFLDNRLAVRDTWHWSMPVPFQPGNGTDGHLDWPRDFKEVPLPGNGTWLIDWDDPAANDGWLPGWLRALYPYDGHLDIPAITAEYVIPVIAMIALPALMVIILNKIGWGHTVRDAVIALFTGFIVVYTGLTIIGVAFRGQGQQLVPPTRVPNLEKDPSLWRQVPPPDSPFVLIDTRDGTRLYG